jgi:hypothetical protein
MSSGISTDRGASPPDAPYVRGASPPDAASLRRADAGFQPWHFFLLISMAAATVAVALTADTHPAALLLLSAAVVAAGLAGYAVYRAMGALFGFAGTDAAPLTDSARDGLLREKALTLRSIKELEFDHAMGKIGPADFQDMSGRLRARALALMEELERAPSAPKPPPAPVQSTTAVRACAACGTPSDDDARFCKHCGKAVA